MARRAHHEDSLRDMVRRANAGYTLIEVVVALVVFTVGALALAATSGVVARSMESNSVHERAGRLARSRTEILKSECAAAVSGAETVGPIYSHWDVARSAGVAAILESTRYELPSATHRDNYPATVWCSM
jgi:prepilin-type N-terminal cleavage/methylation domain-containing protein